MIKNLVSRPEDSLTVKYQPIAILKPDPRNPRLHSPRQIRQIAESIRQFGFNVPLLTDRHHQVVAGHGRLLAAQLLGLLEAPVIQLEALTEAQCRAFAIADNRLSENSTWDETLLAESLKALAAVDLGFDIEATGFTIGEIDLRIEGMTATPAGPDPADEFPAPTNQPPVSAIGDLWQLGRHRILCGDALSADAYAALMQGKKAALVFTDPPYNVPIDGHATGNGKIRHREFAMASGEMSSAQFTQFLANALDLLSKNSKDGSVHFAFMDWRHQFELLSAAQPIYSELKNLCVWVKDNGGMGSLYRSQHELIFVFKNGKGTHRNNVQLGKYGRNRTNVWQYPGVNTFGRKSDEGDLLALHPTVKPVALVADAILDCSTRGDIVLDGFLGSGSTLIAAERVGRVCFGIELDPEYVDTAVRRWQRHTGEHARLATTGKTFDEVAQKTEARHG